MSIPALRKLLFVHRPTTYNVRHSFPKNACRSKTQTIAFRHFYSTRVSIENGANINRAIDALAVILSNPDCKVKSIELPQQGLTRDLIRRLLQSVANRWPILPACGAANPRGECNPVVKVFHKPNFEALKKLEPELNAGRVWAYQMQDIVLNEESIAKLTNHTFEIYNDNCVEWTLDPKAKVLWRPPINPLTSRPDLSDRTVTFGKMPEF
jgi:hypothetical protein